MNVLILISLLVFFAALDFANAAYCSGSPAPGERTNDFPIFDQKLRHIKSVKNGMLFEAGPPNATFAVVHLWGTPYEVGYAQGELRKAAVKEFIEKTWAYLNT